MISIQPATNLPLAKIIAHSPEKDKAGADRNLLQCLTYSEESWVGCIDGDIVCVWGLWPPSILSDQAYIWLLTTDEVAHHKFIFIRQSQLQIEKMLERYPLIVGKVLISNKLAQQWLKWLGARFVSRDNDVIHFEIRKTIQ